MSSPGQLLAFMALSFLIIVIPGPSVLFVIGRALAYGRRTALASAAGNELGMLVLATLVAVGVGPVVQRSESIVTLIRLGSARSTSSTWACGPGGSGAGWQSPRRR